MTPLLTIAPPAASPRLSVSLPGSKSLSARALVVSALAGGGVEVEGLSASDDTLALSRALSSREETADVGAAGTAMRFLTAYASRDVGRRRLITGTRRMQERPIGLLVDALRELGADVRYVGNEGYPPLLVEGRELRGGALRMGGGVSSQYVSALLMIGPTLRGGLSIELEGGVASRPYLDMTMGLMREAGARVAWKGDAAIGVEEGSYRLVAPLEIEADWSAASYWYEIIALTPTPGAEVRLPRLRADSLQGDSAVARMMAPLGVETSFEGGAACLRQRGRTTVHMELDFAAQPDLAQTFVATCAALGVTFRMSGLRSLRIKETDRLRALRLELGRLGFVLREVGDDVLFWNGDTCPRDPEATLLTWDDHRMAMALAPCCLRLGSLRMEHPEVVSKSYPGYWDDLRKAGFALTPGGDEA